MAQVVNPQIPAWAEVNAGRARAFLQLLEHQLRNRPFVCGDAFTVADTTGLVAIDFAKFAQLSLPQDLPNVWRDIKPPASV